MRAWFLVWKGWRVKCEDGDEDEAEGFGREEEVELPIQSKSNPNPTGFEENNLIRV